MSRRHWGIIFAAGLALSAHHPDVEAEDEQPDRQQRVAEALDDIAAAYREQAERSERAPERQPCEPGDEKRDSELCAQWKAADAAADAAWWASVATWVSGASGLFVVFALFAAFQSNSIAKITAYRQLRAYMCFESASVEIESRGDEWVDFKVVVKLRNNGQTPAIIRSQSVVYQYRGSGSGGGYGPPKEEASIIIGPNATHTIIHKQGSLFQGCAPDAKTKADYRGRIVFIYEDFLGKRHTEVIHFASDQFVAEGFNGTIDMPHFSHEPGRTDDRQWPWNEGFKDFFLERVGHRNAESEARKD